MKTNDKLNKLAAMMDKVVQDDPHEAKAKKREAVAAMPAAKTNAAQTRPKLDKKPGQGSAAPVSKAMRQKAQINSEGQRERTAVNLTPSAVNALMRIQAFLITECGAKSVSTSAAMCIALETTAELLGEKKSELGALYQELKMSDGRRKQVA
ncbi:MAG: hypothetical protein KDN22_03780 [Verrucomicrobiae bacterium]|nr:hypothetical protein [Verrucomicrobiae bacterium]